jgi:rhodanese-related sulfurtransferase
MRLSQYSVVNALFVCALLGSTVSQGSPLPSLARQPSLLAGGIPADPQIPSRQMMSPEELNGIIKSSKPLIFYVGPRSLYQQAHIPGAEYIGATSAPEGLSALRDRVKPVPKDTLIVVYCGCCPWDRCPNIRPAYKQLRDLGYSNVRVLYMADNFGTNWVEKGYPVAKGE